MDTAEVQITGGKPCLFVAITCQRRFFPTGYGLQFATQPRNRNTITAYNFARRLKALSGLTRYE